MKCNTCHSIMVKNGKSQSGIQRYYCKNCKKSGQNKFIYNACQSGIDDKLVVLLKESCGTRSISRILGILVSTVTKKILTIASQIKKPPIRLGRSYQMDELITFIGYKDYKVCVAYAIDSRTKQVAGFSVGRRNKTTLRQVTNSLILSYPKVIKTDKLNLYIGLIPEELHSVKRRGTNHIERKNLTLRTHIKRLNRRTIAFSKSLIVLSAVMKIYFWG